MDLTLISISTFTIMIGKLGGALGGFGPKLGGALDSIKGNDTVTTIYCIITTTLVP